MASSSLDKLPDRERKIFKKTMRIENNIVLLKEILKFYYNGSAEGHEYPFL